MKGVLSIDIGRQGAAIVLSPARLEDAKPQLKLVLAWRTFTRKEQPVTSFLAYRGGVPAEKRTWSYAEVVNRVQTCMFKDCHVVLEDVYGGRNLKTVKTLARILGEIEGALCSRIGRDYDLVYASKWRTELLSVKANLPRNEAKEVTMSRVPDMIENWSEFEHRIDARYHEHVLDAVGMGLHRMRGSTE